MLFWPPFLEVFSFQVIYLILSFIALFLASVLLVVWAFWLFLIYLNVVLVVRRLHDLNKSGWMGLLLFIPVVQFFFMIYLLLASGTAGPNQYGPSRPSTFIEKLMAWFILFAILISLISTAGFFYYFSGTDTIQTPSQILQKGTEYF
ncbi:DUF805 domain-containing protein [Acinetobacter pittii]|uniref:DUF805 domain-containing protein n=1 Tax=Acinetobacter pittii TaxID=48296 RepID=A0A3G6YHW0_ACIPI|nr:DUF805 domain-containing protein [Acinetobacter pittii]